MVLLIKLVTGFLGKDYYETGRPISYIIADSLVSFGVLRESILIQDHSSNSLEDVIFGKEILEKNNIYPASILFVAKSHGSGRAQRTLKKFYPNAILFAFTIDGEYDGVKVSKKDWWKNETSKARVYGEYLRIMKYSQRGDIC